MLDNRSDDAADTAAPSGALEIPGRTQVFVNDATSEAALRNGLAQLGEELTIRRGNVRQAIRFFERDSSATAVVVDLDGTDAPLEALENLARVCPPDVTVVVIGENTDIGFYRMLVQDIGVADYVPKPLTRDLVQRVILRHLLPGQTDHQATRGGQVIAVCGATGGSGSSTVAANLAFELANVTRGHTALLDLNLQNGTLASMLGATPGPGLRSALEDPNRADSLFLERTAIALTPRLRLIAADETLDADMRITESGISRVLELMRQRFNHVIVDLPKPPPTAMHCVIGRARQVVVVLEPVVLGLRNATALRRLVGTIAGTDRSILVVNRADMKGALRRALVEKGLGTRPNVTLPDFGAKIADSINLGTPAVLRIGELKRSLAPLVQEISGVRVGSPSVAWLRRVFRT